MLSFGGKKTALDETGLRGFADQVTARLDSDEKISVVKAWVDDAIRA